PRGSSHVPDVRAGRPVLPLSRAARAGAQGGAGRDRAGEPALAVAGGGHRGAGGGRTAECAAREIPFRLRRDGRMSDLTALTLAQARDKLAAREISATELADAHLAAMERARALNAYVLETPERARAMAQAADARIAKGEARPLEGIPIAVKEM